MWAYISYALLLGLSAGISPGPLLTLVIAQTLRHNTFEGIKVALVPLLTDLPIIIVGILLLSSLPNPDVVLGLISIVGGLFVLYLGITSIYQQSLTLDLSVEAPRSYLKGSLVNLLSPHPYLFWFSIGAPLIVKASSVSLLAAVAFVLTFYTCLVGAKIAIAVIVGQSRHFLSGTVYLWIMRGLGICLIGFSLLLFRDGLVLLKVL